MVYLVVNPLLPTAKMKQGEEACPWQKIAFFHEFGIPWVTVYPHYLKSKRITVFFLISAPGAFEIEI